MSVVRPTPESFVVVDLDGAERADGVARWAKKILLDGARWLARSRTYGWASIGERVSGASVGISAPPEERDAALAAFAVAEIPDVQLGLDPGKGVGWDDLAARRSRDWRDPVLLDDPAARDRLVAAGVVAAAQAQLGDLAGRTVAVEGPSEVTSTILEAFDAVGASPATQADHTIASAASAAADLLVCGSAVGLVDHAAAGSLECSVVVPWGPMPVTTRGLAVARRRGVEVLPDFVTTAGPLLAAVGTNGGLDGAVAATRERVAAVVAEVRDHDEGPLVGACVRAEAFLSSWREELPFGRPIA